MVIVNLKGGLGNQLFQYAIGRHISLNNGATLILDITSFENDKLRSYRLDSFIGTKDIKLIKRNLFQRIIYKLNLENHFFAGIFKTSQNYIFENSFNFDPKILKLDKNILLDGYWQSEKYFQDIAPIIRADLMLKKDLPITLAEINDQILSTNSVSIHVRRGDYANNPSTTAFHGLCSTQWYLNAAKKMQGMVDEPHFFIFSDDYEWAKDNIIPDAPYTHIKPSPDGQEAQDLILMSRCQHNIISNSSFSWWAAWLNQNPKKML